MIRTISINISGQVFNINEDAYSKLNSYLSALKNQFGASEGGDEIISDVENRIAELFTEYLPPRQAIEISDVDKVIEVMGAPEDYVSDDENETTTSSKSDYTSNKKTRRLFRNSDDKVLGGVASGVAAYFDTDPVYIRVIWVILFLFYGFGVIPYIILWIVIPEAKTTAEKIQMKGDPVNIDTIEKSIKKEFDSIKNSFSGKKGEEKKNELKGTIESIGDFILSVLYYIAKGILKIAEVIVKIIGFVFIAVAVITIPALIIGLIFGIGVLNVTLGASLLPLTMLLVNGSVQAIIAIVSAMVVVLGPILLILLFGLRIFGVNNKGLNIAKISTIVLMIIAVATFSYVATSNTMDLKSSSSVTNKYQLNSENDTININLGRNLSGFISDESKYDNYKNKIGIGKYSDEINFDDLDFYVKDDSLYIEEVRVYISQSDVDDVLIKVEKSSKGENSIVAAKRAEAINYRVVTDGNNIFIDDFFSIATEDKFRGQSIKVNIEIPEGKVINFDRSTTNFHGYFRFIADESNMWSWKSNYFKSKHLWNFDNGKINCLDCADENKDLY